MTACDANLPQPSALRLVGARQRGTANLVAPFGVPFRDDAEAYAVAFDPLRTTDVAVATKEMPAAASLPAGTLVVLLPGAPATSSFGARVRAAFVRTRAVPRTVRCAAALVHGYVRIGAAVDPESGIDVVWAYAPSS